MNKIFLELEYEPKGWRYLVILDESSKLSHRNMLNVNSFRDLSVANSEFRKGGTFYLPEMTFVRIRPNEHNYTQN